METPNIDNVLAHMECVHKTGADKWICRCPAHNDKSPSLSIRLTPERILLYCFAGCTTEAIITASGLTWGDICGDDPDRQAWVRATAKPLPSPNIDDVYRMIVLVAEDDMAVGKSLSIPDRAYYELAKKYLRS